MPSSSSNSSLLADEELANVRSLVEGLVVDGLPSIQLYMTPPEILGVAALIWLQLNEEPLLALDLTSTVSASVLLLEFWDEHEQACKENSCDSENTIQIKDLLSTKLDV